MTNFTSIRGEQVMEKTIQESSNEELYYAP